MLTKNNMQKEIANKLLEEIKKVAQNIRVLVLSLPPKELLNYPHSQLLMVMKDDDSMVDDQREFSKQAIKEFQFLLEYIHAILASNNSSDHTHFNESKCTELLELSSNLRDKTMIFAMASSISSENTDLGSQTKDVEFDIKSSWVMVRGNRHQVLEEEFYNYALTPHNDALTEIYGIGASEIAKGFQNISDSTRVGQANAFEEMANQFESAQMFAEKKGKSIEEIMDEWFEENPENKETAMHAHDDLFFGGISNVSRHSKLPDKILNDLAYKRGEDSEFFADGKFSGTPFRTLPARKKPLIEIDSEFYAIDPCFIRDAGYRALLHNLLNRKPNYNTSFKKKQQLLSERAFPDILKEQLSGADVFYEVYYKDPETRQWVENDTLILIDDSLYLIEAKAGAAATIASPAEDFDRHIQAINSLILKAYSQCKRFFNYLDSEEEVPLFNRINGKYKEIHRIKRSDYRLMFPIGLTIESFAPYSSYCKELPHITPILGSHGFISISLDDLLVLKRFLPTSGAFSHYMEVRQAIAGIKHVRLYDELDHLGAYILKNRFDISILNQLKPGKADMLVWSGMSDIVDQYFEGENWETKPIPSQNFPIEISNLFNALNSTQKPGWLLAESIIRNFDDYTREKFAKTLSEIGKTLIQHPHRFFTYAGSGSQSIFIWMQNFHQRVNWKNVTDNATAAALYSESHDMFCVFINVVDGFKFQSAHHFKINIPLKMTEDNAYIFDYAFKLSKTAAPIGKSNQKVNSLMSRKNKIGRNELCPCGSGIKFKKCHGP